MEGRGGMFFFFSSFFLTKGVGGWVHVRESVWVRGKISK